MKRLLQSDWERLVKNAERYEAIVAMLHRRELGLLTALAGETPQATRAALNVSADSEVERQGEQSYRASGDCECSICHLPYRKHPHGGPIGWGDEQFLNRLCDGTLVKL